MNLNEFLVEMAKIRKAGYIKSHRTGDTGIGKTLEDLLGIQENNIIGPDFGNYELKSGRSDSSSMLTLFTKAPKPKGVNGRLRDAFGYPKDVPPARRELHVPVYFSRTNTVGLRLIFQDTRMLIDNDKGILAYYDEEYLREAFEKKYRRPLIYILASRMRREGAEWFWFNDAHLLDGFSFQVFSDAIRKEIIKYDIRIGHYPNGRPHDHGTGFRVLPKDLPRCFANIKKLI